MKKTRQELEAAGYKFADFGSCRRCKAPVVWYETPRKKLMAFDRDTLEIHSATCLQGKAASPKEFKRKAPQSRRKKKRNL